MIAFAHNLGHWRALWHDEALHLAGLIHTRAGCTFGRHVIFLHVMHGALPMRAAPETLNVTAGTR